MEEDEVQASTGVTFTLGGGEVNPDGGDHDDRDKPQGKTYHTIIVITLIRKNIQLKSALKCHIFYEL